MIVMTGASNPDGIKQKPSFSRKWELIESEDNPCSDPCFRGIDEPGVEQRSIQQIVGSYSIRLILQMRLGYLTVQVFYSQQATTHVWLFGKRHN